MFIIITKNGKPVDAFYRTSGSGVFVIEHDSPLALLYAAR